MGQKWVRCVAAPLASWYNLEKAVKKRDEKPRVSTTEEMNLFSKGLPLTADVLRTLDARRDSLVAKAVKTEQKEERKRQREEDKKEGKKLAGQVKQNPGGYVRDVLLGDSFPAGKAPAAQATQDPVLSQVARSESRSSARSAGTGKTPSKQWTVATSKDSKDSAKKKQRRSVSGEPAAPDTIAHRTRSSPVKMRNRESGVGMDPTDEDMDAFFNEGLDEAADPEPEKPAKKLKHLGGRKRK